MDGAVGRVPGGPVEDEVAGAVPEQRDDRGEQVGVQAGVGVRVEDAYEALVVRGRERVVGAGDGADLALEFVEGGRARAQDREHEDEGVLDGGGLAVGEGGRKFAEQRLEHGLVGVVIHKVSVSGCCV